MPLLIPPGRQSPMAFPWLPQPVLNAPVVTVSAALAGSGSLLDNEVRGYAVLAGQGSCLEEFYEVDISLTAGSSESVLSANPSKDDGTERVAARDDGTKAQASVGDGLTAGASVWQRSRRG